MMPELKLSNVTEGEYLTVYRRKDTNTTYIITNRSMSRENAYYDTNNPGPWPQVRPWEPHLVVRIVKLKGTPCSPEPKKLCSFSTLMDSS